MVFVYTCVACIILVLIKAGFKGSSVFQFELHLVDSWVSREIPAWEGWIEKHLIKLTMWHFWRRKEHLRRVNRHLECKCCELLQPSPGQPRIATTAAKSSKIPNLIGPKTIICTLSYALSCRYERWNLSSAQQPFPWLLILFPQSFEYLCFADSVHGYCHSLMSLTRPYLLAYEPVSKEWKTMIVSSRSQMKTRWRVGVRSGKKETKENREKRGKINGALCRAARRSSWSIGQEHVFVRHRDQDPFAWAGHRNTSPITPPHAFHPLPFTLQ